MVNFKMALVLQLSAILAIATLSTAQLSKSKAAKKYDPEDIQTQPSLLTILQSPNSAEIPPSLPVNLELPREEVPNVPFYAPEPASIALLKVPAYNYFSNPSTAYNRDYPVPSQELELPSAEPWNPDNDPKFYYQLPPLLTKEEVPTNLYPKKYNKDVYEKEKSLFNRPKQEIKLIPVSEQEYINKQRDADKALHNLAKKQNQKLVEAEKVRRLKYDLSEAQKVTTNNADSKEPQIAETGFLRDEPESRGFDHGSNSDFSSHGSFHSSSAEHHAPPASPHRHEFQMHGHDGPSSYKWGYDTGKGHNRQFRYEERDKHGYVKGHYGYYDKHGKLRLVHYDADPHEGFHAKDNK